MPAMSPDAATRNGWERSGSRIGSGGRVRYHEREAGCGMREARIGASTHPASPIAHPEVFCVTLSRDRISALLSKMAGSRIVVLGDAMLDVYLAGEVERISPEAPVPVVAVRSRRMAL